MVGPVKPHPFGFVLVPWILAVGIVFATLGPQHLRPHLPPQIGPQGERFGAYLLMASTFTLAYPNRKRLIVLGGAIAAVLLELGQGLVPGRDPGLPDAVAKILGNVTGVLITASLEGLWNARRIGGASPRH